MTPKNLAATGLLAAVLLAGPAMAEPVALAPHRATYDLALSDATDGRGVEDARGRIVFEFTGSDCEGYTLNFRQVTQISGGEIGSRISDMRSSTHEEGDGSGLRFNTETRMSSAQVEQADGMATRANGKLVVKLRKPAPANLDLDGTTVFPTNQTKMLIDAARSGQSTLAVKVFDGSEQARKVYDTFAVIGKESSHDSDSSIEEPLRKAGWDKLRRWPISVSYFEGGQVDSQKPLYVISFELLENGVSRALKLNYGDFDLRGQLTRLDVLPQPTSCQK
jgi:hypothetical protein